MKFAHFVLGNYLSFSNSFGEMSLQMIIVCGISAPFAKKTDRKEYRLVDTIECCANMIADVRHPSIAQIVIRKLQTVRCRWISRLSEPKHVLAFFSISKSIWEKKRCTFFSSRRQFTSNEEKWLRVPYIHYIIA